MPEAAVAQPPVEQQIKPTEGKKPEVSPSEGQNSASERLADKIRGLFGRKGSEAPTPDPDAILEEIAKPDPQNPDDNLPENLSDTVVTEEKTEASEGLSNEQMKAEESQSPVSEREYMEQALKGHIAEWETQLKRNEYPEVPEVAQSLKDQIAAAKNELANPAWLKGDRSSNPGDYVYHGTPADNLDGIARTGLEPRITPGDPRPFVWFDGQKGAYYSEADTNSAILRFPAQAAGQRMGTLNRGPQAVSHGIKPYLIDYSRNGGKTWDPISEDTSGSKIIQQDIKPTA